VLPEKLIPRVLIILCALCINSLAHADALTDQAKQLLERKDAAGAYALLAPEESKRAGDPDYDFLLGLAALDSGKSTDAIFAFERVLAVKPDHTRARAEMGRAYMVVGETRTAKQELETARKNAPAEVVNTIEAFLNAIERIDEVGKTVVKGYVEGGFGRDTNINAGPAGGAYAIPALGGLQFSLTGTSAKLSDTFFTLGAGINVRSPLRSDLAIVGGLSYSTRSNNTYSELSTNNLEGNVGLLLTKGQNVYSGILQASSFGVDSHTNRNVAGGMLQWQHNYDQRNQVTAYGQYARLVYPNERLRDADRWVTGMGFAHAFSGFKNVMYAGLYLGTEKERNDHVDFLGSNLWGFRTGTQYELRRDFSAFAHLNWEDRRYGGEDPFFLTDREDKELELKLGVNFLPIKELKFTPQYTYTKTTSNIVINDYRRHVLSVMLRHDF